MKTIVTITGIRPDFIRMAEIFKQLDSADWCKHILIHTGQHYDKLLSDVFFDDLEIRKPDYNLSIGGPGKSHYEQQASLGPAVINLLKTENINPSVVLFLGDSNSVLSSVPLRKEGYKIGHIEAGMRSYDQRMLEEINRKVCDHVSNFLFVYHENYKQKALREGIAAEKIFVVGNTIVEPLKSIAQYNYQGSKNHILLDIHRPENFKYTDRMKNIIRFANKAQVMTGKTVKMLDFGRTTKVIKENNLDIGNIELIPLMGYRDFVKFMQDSLFIISDSGTAQEEPALLNVPVIVPREFTERPESITNGCSKMLDLETDITWEDHINWAIDPSFVDNNKTEWLGNGTTAATIVTTLRDHL